MSYTIRFIKNQRAYLEFVKEYVGDLELKEEIDSGFKKEVTRKFTSLQEEALKKKTTMRN